MLVEKSTACESCTKGFKPATAEKHLLMLEQGQSWPSGATWHCVASQSSRHNTSPGHVALTSFAPTDTDAAEPPSHPSPANVCKLMPGAQQGRLDRNHRPLLSSFRAVWTGQAGGLRTTLLFLKKLIFF